MLNFLVLSASIFIFQWFAYLKRSFDRKSLIKCKEELQAPSEAILLHYQGGNPGLSAGASLVWADAAGLVLVGLKTGKKIIIPKAHIQGVDLHSDVQTLTTGGGPSVTGAVIGDVVAGPVGAIVGGSRRSKTKTEDRSTVHVRVNSTGIETALIFKGGQST